MLTLKNGKEKTERAGFALEYNVFLNHYCIISLLRVSFIVIRFVIVTFFCWILLASIEAIFFIYRIVTSFPTLNKLMNEK